MRPPLIVHAVHTILVICIKGEVQNVTVFATKFFYSPDMQNTFQGSMLKLKAQVKVRLHSHKLILIRQNDAH